MIHFPSKLQGVGTTIFTIMSKLAADHNAINLSQGFPDFPSSPKLVKLVADHMKKGHNQYAPMPGLPLLRERIAAKVNSIHKADYDANTEVTVTAGGTQAIFTALAATVHPNDEVIVFEPAYDCYAPTIRLLGGIVKPYELSPPDWKIDWAMVQRMMTVRTRMIVINSPHNPTGMVLTEDDIRQLDNITRNTDVMVLSDEVYEHLIFDKQKHHSMAAHQGLRERSFVVASFGKLYHTTGWKMGYCLAPAPLMAEFRKVHQFNVFSVNTPMQHAIADFMEDTGYYAELSAFFEEKRNLFAGLMKETRFDLLPCNGSYFQSAYYNRISNQPDTEFTQWMTTEHGVASIPNSAFYLRGTDHGVIRFCFAKKQETLEKAVERLVKV